MFGNPSLRVRQGLLAVLTLGFVLGAGSLAVEAQQDDEAQLEELKQEREAIQVELADQAIKLDAATADFADLAQALDDVNALVDLQQARLADANQRVRSAETQAEVAQARLVEIADEVGLLQRDVQDLAVASFTGEASATASNVTSALSSEPWVAARRRSLIELQTGSLTDGIDRMRALGAEAELVAESLDVSLSSAQQARTQAQLRQGELEASQDAQADLVARAGLRLEARLAEASVIEDRDAQAAAEIRQQEEVIAAKIREEAARRAAIEAAEERGNVPVVATPAEITTVDGIQVHVDIAAAVGEMLAAARADGVDLGGWGYRDSIRQIELRQEHCGTTEYDIWEKPAFSCNPPTARPGQSQHERGLAIDFTYNGGSMTSHSNPGFVWLAANASRWGFVNLPSEPWHWSTTGR